MVKDLETAYELKVKSQKLMNEVRNKTFNKIRKYVYLKTNKRSNATSFLLSKKYRFIFELSGNDAGGTIRVWRRGFLGGDAIEEIKSWKNVSSEQFPYLLMVLQQLSGEYVNLDDKEHPDYVESLAKLCTDIDKAVKELRW
jgi:hypothetical protein